MQTLSFSGCQAHGNKVLSLKILKETSQGNLPLDTEPAIDYIHICERRKGGKKMHNINKNGQNLKEEGERKTFRLPE